jgi:cytochrome c oxidase cbb3-type subunit 4
MFKFIRQYAEKIDHANIYPTLGLLIFVIFFICMIIYVKNMSREDVNELSSLPLDLNDNDRTTNP